MSEPTSGRAFEYQDILQAIFRSTRYNFEIRAYANMLAVAAAAIRNSDVFWHWIVIVAAFALPVWFFSYRQARELDRLQEICISNVEGDTASTIQTEVRREGRFLWLFSIFGLLVGLWFARFYGV